MGVYENFFFTILNCSGKWYFLIFYINRETWMTESFFPISNYFVQEKNVENTQFFTLSIHIFPITNLEKSLCHSDLPIDIKKLLHIIFQLSITHFSEQFKIVKKKSHRWPCWNSNQNSLILSHLSESVEPNSGCRISEPGTGKTQM